MSKPRLTMSSPEAIGGRLS